MYTSLSWQSPLCASAAVSHLKGGTAASESAMQHTLLLCQGEWLSTLSVLCSKWKKQSSEQAETRHFFYSEIKPGVSPHVEGKSHSHRTNTPEAIFQHVPFHGIIE